MDMSDSRTPRERLDALLTGLEDEVLRSDQTGQGLADEGIATETAGAMRSGIESLILARAGGTEPRPGSLRGDGSREVKAKAAQAMERLGRWTGMGRDGHATSAPLRVRMAFSGERSEKVGQTERNATRRRRAQGEAGGTWDEDC